MEESSASGSTRSSISSNSFTAETPSVGDEAEDSESESGLTVTFSKRPRLSRSKTGGKFKKSWDIPFLAPSKKGEKFAYCTLCSRDFSVAHGGLNDAKRHCDSSGHQNKYSECQSNSSLYFRESSVSHNSKVLSAEVMMAQFIALHNVPF